MKSFIGVALVAMVAFVGVASAQAAPAVQARIDGAQIISPYAVDMSVSYRCQGADVEIIGGVTQPNPERPGGDIAYIEDYFPVPCTGRWEQVVLHLHYPSFAETGLEPGQANAYVAFSGIDGQFTKKVRLS